MSEKTQVAKQKDTSIARILERPEMKARMEAVLPSQVSPERMLRLVLSCLRGNPKLGQCTPESFFGAVLQSASLGLEPNTPLGLAYLVPYGKECTFIPGYKGLLQLAYQSGQVKSITAHVVYEADAFSIQYGSDEAILHEPVFGGERGKRIGAYAVVNLNSGGRVQRYLPEQEVLAARPSHWNKGTPWGDKNPYVVDEMWIKTALRRTLKTAPLSPEIHGAIVADEAATRGATWRVNLDAEDLTPELAEQKAAVDIPVVSPGEFLSGKAMAAVPCEAKPECKAANSRPDCADGSGESCEDFEPKE